MSDSTPVPQSALLGHYRQLSDLAEHLHCTFTDLTKETLVENQIEKVNSTQAMMLYRIGDTEVTATGIRAKGIYRGQNASYNIAKLKRSGHIAARECKNDRRVTYLRATPQGIAIGRLVGRSITKHARKLEALNDVSSQDLKTSIETLTRLIQHLESQIRHIR
jgi:DNA-binding MarR family transcriptional regulator